MKQEFSIRSASDQSDQRHQVACTMDNSTTTTTTATTAQTMTSTTTDDMLKVSASSPVAQMYEGRSVFITGASGFIGRVLLEKLLRSYQGIKRVYILMRPKKNLQPKERLNRHVLSVPIFDRIRSMKNGQELLDKITIVTGDIGEPNLGISEQDTRMLISDESLSVVYHSAATVKFDEPLRTSVRFNLIATKAMLELCKRLPNLIALCHVSTAYANSDIKDDTWIEERLYPMSSRPEQLIKLAGLMDEDMMQQIKPKLVGARPNTYTYSKALAEHMIALEASDLPIAIVRPSIVTAAWREPLPGWIDNLNGPTGLVLAVGKGLLRSLHVKTAAKADIIPVDIVVNTMIAAGYYAAKSNNKLPVVAPPPAVQVEQQATKPAATLSNNNNDADADEHDDVANGAHSVAKQPQKQSKGQRTPPIFHCTSGDKNPLLWGEIEKWTMPIIREYPSEQVLRYPFGSFKNNKYHDLFTRLFVHYLPALIIDLLCMIMGKKRQLLSIYFKLHCAVQALSSFTTQNYNFKSDNMRLLSECLTDEQDKRELYMDITAFEWTAYWQHYILGARRYVLKEDDSTLEKARRSFKKAYYYEIGFRVLLLALAAACCLPLVTRFAAPCYVTGQSLTPA